MRISALVEHFRRFIGSHAPLVYSFTSQKSPDS